MFSRLRRIFKNKLTRNAFLLYFASHLISIAVLFITIYVFLSSALSRSFKQLIETRAGELAALYKDEGLEALKRHQAWAYVRVLDQNGKEISLTLPGEKSEFDLKQLTGPLPKNGKKTWSTVSKTDDEDKLFVLTQALDSGHYLQVGKSDEDINDEIESLLGIYLGVIGPLLFLSVIGAFFFTDKMLVQYYELLSTLSKIKSGAIRERAHTDPSLGELNDLVTLFNSMMDQIELLLEKTRGEVDQFAHDVRTPLTRFRLLAEKALIEQDNPKLLRSALEEAVEAAESIQIFVSSIFDLSLAESGAGKLVLSSISLFDLTQEIVTEFKMLAEEKDITLDSILRSRSTIKGDTQQLRRIIGNLLDNAIKFSPAWSRISIVLFDEGNEVKLLIHDQGPGIPEADLSRIWDKFFRGEKAQPGGFGLGLSFVKAMTERHGGKAIARSREGNGAEFLLTFPIEK